MQKRVFAKVVLISLLIVSLTFIGGCANISRREGGAFIGAGAGAGIGQMIGHSAEATLIGLLIGTALGFLIGNEMDKLDRQNVNYAYETQPDNQSLAWKNPNSGNQYKVTPKTTYGPESNPCRTAIIDSIIDGKREKVETTACRDARGIWVLQ